MTSISVFTNLVSSHHGRSDSQKVSPVASWSLDRSPKPAVHALLCMEPVTVVVGDLGAVVDIQDNKEVGIRAGIDTG
jgi:hypothetical protein